MASRGAAVDSNIRSMIVNVPFLLIDYAILLLFHL